MRMPDCRNDEYYNQKYLNERDKAELSGFDYCAEGAVDIFFDNIDTYFDDETYLGHVLNEELSESMKEEYLMEFSFGDEPTEERKCETYADLLRMRILEWIEMTRNDVITSMIEGMDDEEYEAIKAKVDGNE